MSVRVTRRTRILKDGKYADAWAELHLVPDAPPEVVHAAYRALARKYHPDTGNGDIEAMTRLNASYAEITSSLEDSST